ncbi:MAG TPA: hypothetical protein VI431_16260 [Candidatus Acidoferrum sp.]
MLKSVDILIGLSVVMLVVSMAVTILTQFVVTTLNTRGAHLKRGLSDLLQQLDPALTAAISEEISKKILTHPLISDVRKRLGAVVHREEFIKMLMDLAAGNGPQKLEGDALDALKNVMKNNGIANPSATLDNIRSFALALEKSNPELANNVRLNNAIMHEASSQFIAKIHGWFDQTIDRVGDRFTASTRVITVLVALVVAFAIQLDSIALVNRLSTDTQLRQSLVQSAKGIDQGKPSAAAPSQTPSGSAEANPSGGSNQSAANAQKKPPVSNPAAAANDTVPQSEKSAPKDTGKPMDNAESQKDAAAASISQAPTVPAFPNRVLSDVDAILGNTGLISAPDWKSLSLQKLLGILLSAMLLSLGAPFWYGTLKTGLRLRAAIADKDDAQRLKRQTTQPSSQPPPSGSAKAGTAGATGGLAGEQGDLSALG